MQRTVPLSSRDTTERMPPTLARPSGRGVLADALCTVTSVVSAGGGSNVHVTAPVCEASMGASIRVDVQVVTPEGRLCSCSTSRQNPQQRV